ncbi:hypothetical protein ACH42_12715 [Endozoicomonas sp. (ex Bugula neritina AB1)]|nr:hypothetical protein ACH42_12715 [Endozoicomonas sp. (ex Bugula neritina AB1)]
MTLPIVAHIIQHMAPGGIEAMVLDLQSKASVPENVYIISLEGTFDEASQNWSRVRNTPRLLFLNKQSGLSYQTIKQLTKLLKQLNVSVVHTHHVGPLLYGGLAAKLARCKHTHTEHDAWHLIDNKRRVLVAACFYLLRPRVAVDAEVVARNIRNRIPFRKLSVIINGVDADRFSPGNQTLAREQLNIPEGVIIIGCAARFTAVKSHKDLIDAMLYLPEHVHLALAGGGVLEDELRNQVTESTISDRVHFVGVVDNMPKFYHAIDLFCMVSQREGLPLSPLEAQASGRAALLTDVGGCREAVDPNSGLLVPYGNKDLLQKALLSLLKTGLTPKARESARNFVLENANLGRMVRQYEQLYQGEVL